MWETSLIIKVLCGSPEKQEISKQPFSWFQWVNFKNKVLKGHVCIFFFIIFSQHWLVVCIFSPIPTLTGAAGG